MSSAGAAWGYIILGLAIWLGIDLVLHVLIERYRTFLIMQGVKLAVLGVLLWVFFG